jgi:epoxyqueuosine reductase QueG
LSPADAEWLAALANALAQDGLNHLGVVGRARYNAAAPPAVAAETLLPGARAVVVIGSGGRAHWARFVAWLAEDPVARLAERAHPLDDFCADSFARISPLIGEGRVVFPTFSSAVQLDFMRLGELAGLGRMSELGILVSERFGPWFGLRAALFTPRALDESPPARRLCDGCPAPCRAACPPRIVGPWPFAWQRCVDERAATGSPCRSRCGARERCVVAPEARYDELELAYHYDRPRGRVLLCARLGVTDRLPS